MPPVQIGDKIRPLSGGGRQLRCGDETPLQHFLLIFAVEQQESRKQILDVPKQFINFPARLALAHRHPFLP